MRNFDRFIYSIVLFSFLAISCANEDEAEPIASFIINNTNTEVDETISFTNTSENAISYLWDFGDGNTSTIENPKHSYSSDGLYAITLTSTGEGGVDSSSKVIEITPEADILPGIGAAGVKIGDAIEDMLKIHGEQFSAYPFIFEKDKYIWRFEYKDKGIDFYSETLNLPSSGSYSNRLKIQAIEVKSPYKGRTKRNIRIGSTKMELREAYDSPVDGIGFIVIDDVVSVIAVQKKGITDSQLETCR